ncbi:MAG TPA: 2-amino-4-hydroxy-6-hydroxymethyldihydropteridine diphosphokinase [Thermoanaerobaculia bacterium]|nr:2-amino-4-hydroxy-6-hydroxymethyldihydropteridine diphosphokinase [Thermoanaerobaculia bacterium]
MLHTVVIALGSNLGDRRYHLRRAVHALGAFMRVVRVSAIRETAPVGTPPGSPHFLNMVVAGYTTLTPHELLEGLLAIESRLGRTRRGVRNEPRVIDLDLILHGAHRVRSARLTLPHPRYRGRRFVMEPLAEVTAFPSPSPTPPPHAHA